MYQFVKAVCLARSIGSQWHEVDLSQIILHDIFTTYSKAYLELSNTALTEHVYVDIDYFRPQYSSSNLTLAQLLTIVGNNTLPTVLALPSTTVKYAKYSDCFRSQYKVEVTRIGESIPYNAPEDFKKDLVLSRPKYTTDMALLHDYCLISVNGYYHFTDKDEKHAYVYDGGTTMRHGHSNQLGILSFLDIGQLKKIKLKESDIVPQNNSSTLKDKIYFSVDSDLNNKSYLLVLGGYLVFPEENVFWRQSEYGFALDINRIPYLERLYESGHYIDLQNLNLTKHHINNNLININEVFSDTILKKYLTLSQSYLVVIDTPYLMTNKIYLRHSHLPGMFTSYTDPVYPLIVGYGKVGEYWKTFEDRHWAVNVSDSYLRNFIFSQSPEMSLHNITDNMVSSKPFYHSRGYFLEIAGYTV